MGRRKKDSEDEGPVTDKQFLDSSELYGYETFHLKREINDLKIKLLQAEGRYHVLAKAHEELKHRLVGHQIADQQRTLDNLVDSHKKFDREVRERHNIEGDVFGFHPETGEIALSK
jgi:hypothetical protein